MTIGRLARTVRYLKLRQIWFQVWRRGQRAIEPHPKCGDGELPEFTFLNLTAKPQGWNDVSLDMLWRYNLHYFDGLVTKNTNGIDDCVGLVERWIAENPKGSIPGWDPYPTSLRIVNWVKYLNNNLTLPVPHRLRVEDSLRDQLHWLANHVEWHIMANHLMANLKALVIGNKWFGRESAKWMRLYKVQIEEQILPDGGHFERSIMYHAIMLEDALDVIKFCGDDAIWLKPIAEKMLRYLVNMTGPDGKIAMFNDAAEGIAKPTAWLACYAKRLGIEAPIAEPFVDFPDIGYTRMSAGDFVLFVDSAPIGPDYQPGHAHADTLTYELYYKGQKIVRDVGTSEYRGLRRSYERSSAAHNVVEVEGRDSSEVWSSHRVGKRARIVAREVSPRRVFAAHNGYGVVTGREFRLSDDGLIISEVSPVGRKCETRVHLTANAVIANGAGKMHLEHGDLCFDGFTVSEDYFYAIGFGRLEKGKCLLAGFDNGEYIYKILKANKGQK